MPSAVHTSFLKHPDILEVDLISRPCTISMLHMLTLTCQQSSSLFSLAHVPGDLSTQPRGSLAHGSAMTGGSRDSVFVVCLQLCSAQFLFQLRLEPQQQPVGCRLQVYQGQLLSSRTPLNPVRTLTAWHLLVHLNYRKNNDISCAKQVYINCFILGGILNRIRGASLTKSSNPYTLFQN